MLKIARSIVAPNIVTRLRFVFAFISVVLCAALFVGLGQINRLNHSVEDLTTSSVAVFVASEEIGREQNRLLLFLRGLDGTDQAEVLSALQGDLAENLASLRSKTKDLAGTGASEKVASDLSKSLDQIETGTAAIYRTKQEIFDSLSLVSTLEGRLEILRNNTRNTLENMSYAVSDLEFLQELEQGGMDDEQVVQVYTSNLIQAITVTSLTLEVEAVIDKAFGLSNMTQPEPLQAAENVLRFKMRGIASLLSQVKQSTNRTELAGEVFAIRDLIVSDDGLLAQVAQLQAGAARLEAQIIALNAPIQTISALSQTLTQTAQQQIDAAKLELNATSDRIVLVLSLAAILVFGAIVLSVCVVVERQINGRMEQLTKAVLAIAGGDTDHPVTVAGTDELGRMSDALLVFKQNADELTRSNLELERFAYIAAHDLRSPLRAIKDLTEWTLEDPETHFSEDASEYMGLVRSRIDRLNKLLTDLLEYSRAGHEDSSLGDISLAQIVAETAEMLDPDKAFTVRYSGPKGLVTTHATPLQQILLNLISNAIKHHDKSVGQIVVDVGLDAGRIRFSVDDDGPGIEPQYHDRIFGLFQTLRSRDEVEGSGLGLAIIRKLVERYGGTIQIQSDPNSRRGCRFSFDLPDHAEVPQTLKHAA